MLLEFLHSTYAAAADLGKWNRTALERHPRRRPRCGVDRVPDFVIRDMMASRPCPVINP
jgi:hypothetical protein